MNALLKSALVVCSIAAFTACKKEKDNVTPDTTQPSYGAVKKAGKFHMHFHNVVDGKPLVLDSVKYVTDSKDTFTVNIFSYYISNLVFHTEGGSHYAELNSIHRIDQKDPNTFSFTVTDVPPGVYDSVTLMIGLDEKFQTAEQRGPLDPVHGMFWNTEWGYMAARLEGTSPQSLDTGRIKYQVGGYKGLYIGNRTVGIKFQNTRYVDNNDPHIRIEADAGRFFYGEHNIRLGVDFGLDRPNPLGVKVADNYKRMFTQKD